MANDLPADLPSFEPLFADYVVVVQRDDPSGAAMMKPTIEFAGTSSDLGDDPMRLRPAPATLNARSWRKRRLQPKTAFSRFPPVHRAEPEGPLRVDLTRSPSRRRTTGICAKETAGVDVLRT
jgi:hypothetical protein